jgi:hydroxycarboxylate dehydrogenase B
MPEVDLARWAELMRETFVAVGSPDSEARLVAGEIATANRLGVESHGLLRFPQYVNDIKVGRILPGAAIQISDRTETTAIVDCGYTFGQVGAFAALQVTLEIAAVSHVACVVTRRSNHVGRVGAYVEAAARRGFICVALVTTSPRSHMVAPFGGLEGRLGTNPIAYAAPSLDDPIVSDFATSVYSEGKMRIATRRGSPLPEAAAIERDGTISSDPTAFYGPSRGALLPLGGGAGYKGMALGILAEILGGQLAGSEPTDEMRPANGLFLLVIDPAAFAEAADFTSRVSRLGTYIRSAPSSGSGRILVPGDRELLRAEEVAEAGDTVWVDDTTWRETVTVFADAGIDSARWA